MCTFSFLRFGRFSLSACRVLAALVLAGLPLGQAIAADKPLVEGGGVVITAGDLQADAQRIPPAMRTDALKQPRFVEQMALNLYIRRVMAERARKLSLRTDADLQTLDAVAQDRVLSDAYLAYLDAQNAPADSAVLAQARAIYQAQPARFARGEAVRLNQIFLKGSDEATLARARQLVQALREGADFAAMARQNSADVGSALKGGDLGFLTRERMTRELGDAAFALRMTGDISEPVPGDAGVHILQLRERRDPGVPPFDEVRDALVEEVRGTILQEVRAAEAQRIRAQAQAVSPAIEEFARQSSATSTSDKP